LEELALVPNQPIYQKEPLSYQKVLQYLSDLLFVVRDRDMANQFSEIIWHHRQMNANQVAQEHKKFVETKGSQSQEARAWAAIAQPLPKNFSRINIAHVVTGVTVLLNQDGSPVGLNSIIMNIYRDAYCKAYRWASMYISLGELGLADMVEAVHFDQHFMRILRQLAEIYHEQLLKLNIRPESLESKWRLSSPCRFHEGHPYHVFYGPGAGMQCLMQRYAKLPRSGHPSSAPPTTIVGNSRLDLTKKREEYA
jgi:hypothetical protein